jgi:hypothetical protein
MGVLWNKSDSPGGKGEQGSNGWESIAGAREIKFR